MIAAMRAATAEAFGDNALDDVSKPDSPEVIEVAHLVNEKPLAPQLPALTAGLHVVFLVSLVVGGALSAFLSDDGLSWTTGSLRSSILPEIFGDSTWMTRGVLVCGGVLVGFGTRMSSGCTSGHGLCGVSRARPAGLLATGCFFGSGIALSLLLGRFI
jgi:uncharacterized membrane protein YedE/YeeE